MCRKTIRIGYLLAATTALVSVASMAERADAAEKISLGLGGFMSQWVGWADNDDITPGVGQAGRNYHSFDQQSDSEIYVTGSSKLDNGVTVSVVVNIEADTANGAGIDESYLKVESPTLGTLLLGGHDDAGAMIVQKAPDVGIGFSGNDDGTWWNWIIAPAAITYGQNTYFNPSDDANKITYLTPTFYGLTLGGSFTPDIRNNTNSILATDERRSLSVGGLYSREIGEVKLAAQLAYGRVGAGGGACNNAIAAWQSGASLEYKGFIVSGGLADYNTASRGCVVTQTEGVVWDAGIAYKTGPYGVSASMFQSSMQGSTLVAGDDEVTTYMFSGSYTLGPGVDVKGSVFHADYDDETSAVANSNDGWGVVGGLALTF